MRPILSNNYYVYFQEEAYLKLNKFIADSKHSKIFILVDENTNENWRRALPARAKDTNENCPPEQKIPMKNDVGAKDTTENGRQSKRYKAKILVKMNTRASLFISIFCFGR